MIIIVMGVAGAGKTCIGQLLARRLQCSFLEADDFHPSENIRKMSQGIPLTDEDRMPWLLALHQELAESNQAGNSVVLACSALKQKYRDLLSDRLPVCWVYLKGSSQLIRNRLQHRLGHFMKADMVQSQFQILEEPADALTVDAASSPNQVVDFIVAHLTVDKAPNQR
jgi:gluconokinase